jgi:hypothetical protein
VKISTMLLHKRCADMDKMAIQQQLSSPAAAAAAVVSVRLVVLQVSDATLLERHDPVTL